MSSRYGVARWAMMAAALLISAGPLAVLGAADLAKYRDFQLGTGVSQTAEQARMDVSEVKVIHRRPGLIQELEWRPVGLGSGSQPDSVKQVVLTFYQGELFRIAVHYDRYGTEGMTVADFVEAISADYGVSATPRPPETPLVGRYTGPEAVVAQWQNDLYRYDLVRSDYGPAFRLVGTLKRLESVAEAAMLEGARLDEVEAPMREAARRVAEEAAAKSTLDKARLVNKPKFRP